jgi:hypothetical protein
MKLALRISKVTTPIFMGATYFLVLMPIGLVLRAMGKNPMGRVSSEGSFWTVRPEGPSRRSNLERQF